MYHKLLETCMNITLWERYWLPPGATWEDMKESADTHYPKPQDLWLCIPGALLLIVVRCIFERWVPQIQLLLCLLSAVSVHGCSRLTLIHLLTTIKLAGVYRLYHKHSNTMCLLKCFFILLMYTIRAMGSYCCLLFAQKPWVWDHTVCWLRYPQQPLLPALGWFYLLELSFYCSLVITLPFDVKRKDFKEQIIHHIATITLIFVSYCANLIRLGVMIMLVHDASDYLLELAKILHYMKWKQICKAVFMVFAVVFISSRLVIFPLMEKHCLLLLGGIAGFQPAMFFLSCLINAFLMILQLLHIFWSYLILRMTFGLILYGAVRKIFFSSMTTRSSVVLHTCKERVGEKGLPNQTAQELQN
uniref:TLC domain-containing protein n=1 Tax=Pavo cristatus TaxID=9049 RepID=A0A8C9L5B7_PAVCR